MLILNADCLESNKYNASSNDLRLLFSNSLQPFFFFYYSGNLKFSHIKNPYHKKDIRRRSKYEHICVNDNSIITNHYSISKLKHKNLNSFSQSP